MGGLVVIDFIDMSSNRNQRAVKTDSRGLRARSGRIQVGRISRLACSRCRDSVSDPPSARPAGLCARDVQARERSATLNPRAGILRLIQEEAAKERTGEVQAIVPVDVSAFLLNEKRSDINEIESRAACALLLSPAPISTHLT